MLRKLLEACVMPPLAPLLVATAGVIVWRRRPKLARALVAAGVALLWLFATPVVAGALLGALQRDPALDPAALPQAQAIVVLSGDTDVAVAEYGTRAGLGPMTLQRVRYAAWLQRASSAPLLASGGPGREGAPPLAELMARALREEFGAQVRWIEPRSGNTWENAVESARVLREQGVQRVLLVTHAWHMPRAARSFRAQGLQVVPAPTGFRGPAYEGPASLVPSWSAVRDTALAMHEMIGLVWYGVVHR
jgi:uncharacterized SAM-binding protein YcdF (DUF218 family)